MKLSNLEFYLPKNRIALKPLNPRDTSSLVEVKDNFKVLRFKELSNILNPGDCLVFNNTKVIPSHLIGVISGKKIEITLNKQILCKSVITWTALCKPLKKVKQNDKIFFSESFYCIVKNIIKEKNPFLILEFNYSINEFKRQIKKLGSLAIPPYITKSRQIKKKR